MIRRPPRSTRTDTLFPYTTLFRSFDRPKALAVHAAHCPAAWPARQHPIHAQHLGLGAEELCLSADHRPGGADLRRHGEERHGLPHAGEFRGDLRAVPDARSVSLLCRATCREPPAEAFPPSMKQWT